MQRRRRRPRRDANRLIVQPVPRNGVNERARWLAAILHPISRVGPKAFRKVVASSPRAAEETCLAGAAVDWHPGVDRCKGSGEIGRGLHGGFLVR